MIWSGERLCGYCIELTVIGRLNMGEAYKVAQPIIAKGLPENIKMVAQLSKQTYIHNIRSAYPRGQLK